MKTDEKNDKEMFQFSHLFQEGQQEFFAPVITIFKLITSQVVLNSYTLI